MRGYAGELLNRADRITGDQSKRSEQLEADRSRAEDLDMIKIPGSIYRMAFAFRSETLAKVNTKLLLDFAWG